MDTHIFETSSSSLTKTDSLIRLNYWEKEKITSDFEENKLLSFLRISEVDGLWGLFDFLAWSLILWNIMSFPLMFLRNFEEKW